MVGYGAKRFGRLIFARIRKSVGLNGLTVQPTVNQLQCSLYLRILRRVNLTLESLTFKRHHELLVLDVLYTSNMNFVYSSVLEL